MNYLIKPISEPHNSAGNSNLYWLVYPVGMISTPRCVFTDYEMEQFVKQYCEFRKLVLADKEDL